MKLKTGDMLYVEWVDSESQQAWSTPDSIMEHGMLCMTCSFFVENDENYVLLAGSRDPVNNNWANYMKIPKCAIQKIKKLVIR